MFWFALTFRIKAEIMKIKLFLLYQKYIRESLCITSMLDREQKNTKDLP